jgi:hypothetical protein
MPSGKMAYNCDIMTANLPENKDKECQKYLNNRNLIKHMISMAVTEIKINS